MCSKSWTIALIGLTGLRLGKLLAPGHFTITDHPYLLHFEGPDEDERSGFDCITLVPAWELILDLLNFRARWEIQELMKLQEEEYTQALNKFDAQVNRECHKYLADFVPRGDGRKRVTLLILRSVWEEIALWMFCSTQQDQEQFTRQYLLRGMESAEIEHRLRYRLVDEVGRSITFTERQGWMLEQVPDFPLRQDTVEIEVEVPPKKTRRSRKVRTDRSRGQGVEDGSAALDGEILEQLAVSEELEESEGIRWLIAQVRALEQENQALEQDHRALVMERNALKLELERSDGAKVQQLEAQTRSLAQQLDEAQTMLDQVRILLLGDDS